MHAKKILCFFLISSIIASLLPTAFAVSTVDFNVKIATAGDETYATSLNNVSYFNTDITFQFVEVSGGGATEYSLSMPAGFTYQSSNTIGTTCAGFSILNNSNGNFRFSFNGVAGCLAKTEFTYRVISSAPVGNSHISLLLKNGSAWTIAKDITLGITSTNSIIKAVTADLNSNGYIDAYILSFATSAGVTAPALSGVIIAGVTTSVATASGFNWILPFTDNILGTGNTPQVGGIFDGVALTNSLINETDGARPRIMTIAGTSTTTGAINIGTGVLTMTLSESLFPSSTGSFSFNLGTGAIAGIMSLTGNLSTLVFTPTSSLSQGTYTLSNTTGAIDWPAGINVMSQAFPSLIVPDTIPPGTGSILINAGAASTTSQTVSLTLGASDNIGVTEMMISNSPTFIGGTWEAYTTSKASWSLASSALITQTVYVRFRDLALNVSADYSDNITIVAVPPSSGGGGGGGSISADICPTGDLSGNFYDGKCSSPVTTTSITSTGVISTSTGTVIAPVATWIPTISSSPSSLSASSMDTRYFLTLEESRAYLLGKITHSAIVKLINSYGDKLTISDISYYLSVDSGLYSEYNRIINAYTLLFLRVQDAVSGNKSETVKSEGRLSVGIVLSGVAFAKNFLDRYITRAYLPEHNITLYRTKNPLLMKPLSILESKVLAKFNTLLESETISRNEYETSVQAYDDFVLHLMIYRDYGKNILSKERALKAIKIFSTTYAKKVVPKSETTIDQTLEQKRLSYIENNTSSAVQKIGEIYTFLRDLIFGETSQDIRNLQTIL
ncbi:TPA: hypothetical protein DCZ36_03830, partial [Candidatus Gracilibacteria bacterium]|nr:hypothetical protein [Candidatus Gracilibacteria bacterium]